jgi:rubrerythrin
VHVPPGPPQHLAPTTEESSRRRFLKLAGAGAGASLTALIAACGGSGSGGSSSTGASSTQSSAPAPGGDGTSGDIDVLNYALTLEYLEAGFYAKVVDSGVLKGSEQDLAKRFGAAEQAHVETIRSTITKLGGKPVAEPKAKFPLEDRVSVLKLAATVENLGAAAYLGQAGNISSPDVLAAALSIHSVEARHAAALNNLLGREVTPDGAFAKPASKQDVLKAVQPFLAA